MEIELKYLADRETIEKMIGDMEFRALVKEETLQTLNMHAIYYDTEDKALTGSKIAIRARYENDDVIATIKWGGGSVNGLHTRGEINATVDESFVTNPDVSVFSDCEMFDTLKELTEGKKLVPVMDMHYVRTQIQADTGKSVSILSYDEGEIVTAKGTCPISEVEVELCSGDENDMLVLGKSLAEKYNLKAEDISKFKRGLMVLEG